MILNDAQRKQVTEWIAEGRKLSEIQNLLISESGLRMTYMEVRLLVDDLKLTPKDSEPATPVAPLQGRAGGTPPNAAAEQEKNETAPTGVSVKVDQLARPGTVASGQVTFSDGKRAAWYFDETGRLGLVPEVAGYRPPQSDLQDFQMALEHELARLGL